MPTQTVKSIEIQARRWFQKFYGNTYFAGEIYVNDELAAKIDFEYGYENHCVDRLVEEAIKNNNLPCNTGDNATWRYLDSVCPRENQMINIVDVKRKKDL